MDGDFYEANLSSTDKIQKTSVNRELVQIVEEISIEWMRIVEKILIKGKVTRRAPPNTGPIDELEYWLQMHSMYSIAQEQMSMETFQNHLECLKISGSKLVQVNQLICLHRYRLSHVNLWFKFCDFIEMERCGK